MKITKSSRSRTVQSLLLTTFLCFFAEKGSFAGEIVETGSGWLAVRHPAMIMFVPADWDIETNNQDSDVKAISPLTSPQDQFRETLLVKIHEVEEGETLEQFTDELCRDLAKNEESFTITDRGTAEIGKNTGIRIDVSLEAADGAHCLEIYLVQEENRIYSFVVRAENDQLDGLGLILDQIIAALYPFPEVFGKIYFHDFFLIQFPASWDVKEGLPGTQVAGISPKFGPKDPFRERITIGTEAIPGNMTFEEYADQNFNILLNQLPGARERKRGTFPVMGIEAPEIELTHRAYGSETILRVILVPFQSQVFALICAGRDPDYYRVEATFDKILNSFASVSPPANVPPIQ